MIAAFISCVFSFLTYFLFKNHRAMEIIDAEQMLDIETHMKKHYVNKGLIVHSKQNKREYIDGRPVWEKQFEEHRFTAGNRVPSFQIWTYGFLLTACISAVLIAYNIALCFPNVAQGIHSMDRRLKAFIFIAFMMASMLMFFWKARRSWRKKAEYGSRKKPSRNSKTSPAKK